MFGIRIYVYFIFLLSVYIIFLSCDKLIYEPEDYDITDSVLNKTFSLKTKDNITTIPADGYSELKIIARIIEHEIDTDKRTVIFSTTAGTLIGGATIGETEEVVINDERMAIIYLRSDQNITTALVKAQVKNAPAIVREVAINFSTVNPDSIFQFIDFPASAQADGFSLNAVTVRVSSQIPSGSRQVTFTTTGGTFASTNNQTAQIMPNVDNRATAVLKSPNSIQTTTIKATVNTFSREISINFMPIIPDSIIRFITTPNSAPADGATLSTYSVRISPQLPLSGRRVTFSTTSGTFAVNNNNTIQVTADQSNIATAILKSPNIIENGLISATINGLTRDATTDFQRADPEQILLNLGAFQIKASLTNSIIAKAQLIRNVGTVTPGTIVTFNAADSLGNPIGLFGDITLSNSMGEATAIFTTGATTYRGRVTITSGTTAPNLTATAMLQVVDP
ncbi:MAG: hypothetical protein ACRBF0_13960 [Calditrichia bacterium]